MDGKLVLVDYKTDRAFEEEELIKRYSTQLNIYERALEKSLDKKVDRIYIYSTYLEKVVEIKKST